jgi:hypothetical protein
LPQGANSFNGVLLFPEKEAKSVVPLRGSPFTHPFGAEADPGGVGACKYNAKIPEKTDLLLLWELQGL